MRNRSRENYSDWKFQLPLHEKRIFKWRLGRGTSPEEKLGGWGSGVLGQSKEKKRLGML